MWRYIKRMGGIKEAAVLQLFMSVCIQISVIFCCCTFLSSPFYWCILELKTEMRRYRSSMPRYIYTYWCFYCCNSTSPDGG